MRIDNLNVPLGYATGRLCSLREREIWHLQSSTSCLIRPRVRVMKNTRNVVNAAETGKRVETFSGGGSIPFRSFT